MRQSEWGDKILFSHGKSNSKGVAILFNNIECEILDTKSDANGRYLMIKIMWENVEYIIINCYAPPKDHKKEQLGFIEFIKSQVLNFDTDNLIMSGDFNFLEIQKWIKWRLYQKQMIMLNTESK